MSASLDEAAFMEAFEAYWNAGRTDEGLKAAIAKYLDCLGLTLLHSLIVAEQRQKAATLAGQVAHARRCGIAGGMKQ